MADEQPGDRLKSVIEAMGVTYDRFGELVAANELPARKKPYQRNNVGEWVSGRSSPQSKTWAAIERVTGKPFQWFHEPAKGRRGSVKPDPKKGLTQVTRRDAEKRKGRG